MSKTHRESIFDKANTNVLGVGLAQKMLCLPNECIVYLMPGTCRLIIIILYTMASNGTSYALTCCQRNGCSLQNTERSVDIR